MKLDILPKPNYLQVWNALKSNTDDSEQPIHELDVLSGHENDVNYVQFRFVCPKVLKINNIGEILVLFLIMCNSGWGKLLIEISCIVSPKVLTFPEIG